MKIVLFCMLYFSIADICFRYRFVFSFQWDLDFGAELYHQVSMAIIAALGKTSF